MTRNKPVISVQGLEKSFQNLTVLKKIDLTVDRGSILALLGPNGAGKTTMIKILATLLKPDQGSVRIDGYDVVKQPDRVRGVISLTGQSAAVDGILTGRENLRLIGKLRHLPDAAEQADQLLERFDLLEAADRRVAAYSGGMRRRLDLAMSLLGNPPVIFLDEPTTGLDPQSRLTMWQTIRELARAGTTIFLTTQYLEEADQLADRIAILNEGEIIAEGTAEDLKKLLPHGHIELRFQRAGEARAARKLLAEYQAEWKEGNATLSLATDGSVKETTEILSRLAEAKIEVAEFTQKQPTLEEVFLTVTGKSQRRKEALS